MKILITSISDKVELVKQFKRAANTYPGTEIIVADSEKYSPALYYGDSYQITPTSEHPDFIPYITLFCKENGINLLVPNNEAEANLYAKNADGFTSFNCKIAASSIEAFTVCLNRRKLNDFLLANGFETPETYSKNADIKLPIIARPVNRLDDSKCVIIQTEKHFNRFLDENGDEYILQRNIDWAEFSVEVFSDFDGNVISVVPIELVKTEGDDISVARIIHSDIIIDRVAKLVSVLGLIGHNFVRCFYNGTDVLIADVHFGFGPTSNFSFSAGTNSPERLLEIVSGENIQPGIQNYESGLVWLKYNAEIIMSDDENQLGMYTSREPKIYCFAIDGTICSESEPYEKALPIQRIIDRINMLFESGNTIILYSSRGDTSGYNWFDFTEKQLKKWGVKYNELRTNKPNADFYIDNNSINVFDLT